MTDVKVLYERVLERFGEHVHAVAPEQWHEPTPCAGWDVRVLVHHLVYEIRWMPPLLAGQTIAEVGDRLDGDLLGGDPGDAWDRSAAEARGAVAGADVDAIVHVSYGDISAHAYLFEVSSDLAIHGWDLARAIGAEERLDPETVEVLYEHYKPMEDRLKASGVFGPRVDPPPGADRQTELLAVFGRVA